MNKTLKTVLITLGVVLVVLIAVVLIFGEESPTDKASSKNDSVSSDVSNLEESTETPSNEQTELTEEDKETLLAYDIFDWNGADEQGKLKIAQFGYIKENLYDQANIFEVACNALQTDPAQFQE